MGKARAREKGKKKVRQILPKVNKIVPFFSAIALLSSLNKNKKQRKAMIEKMPRTQKNMIGGMMRGFLYDQKYCNHPKVDATFKRKLKRDRKYIEKLAEKLTPDKEFKKIVYQKGGLITALLPIAASLAGPLLKGLFRLR